MGIILIVLVAIIVVLMINSTNLPANNPKHAMPPPKNWIKAGGLLGLAIVTARVTKTPLATILSAMPFLLDQLRKAEMEQNRNVTSAGAMTREEAALILGVETGAGEGDVLAAHRRLIQKNHPDVGGTDYLAARINQARDILLKK